MNKAVAYTNVTREDYAMAEPDNLSGSAGVHHDDPLLVVAPAWPHNGIRPRRAVALLVMFLAFAAVLAGQTAVQP